MKTILVLLFAILFLSQVSAIDISLKEKYPPGETIIISIQGNFISPLNAEDISFYSGRQKIPLISGLGKIGEKYYLYAENPLVSRNYTLKVSAHYLENSIEQTRVLEKNFSVSGASADFSVSPGFAIAKDEFEILIVPHNSNTTVSSNFLSQAKSISLSSGVQKREVFSVSSVRKATISTLKLSSSKTSYEIPVSILGNPNYTGPIDPSNPLNFLESTKELIVTLGKERSFFIFLNNTGNTSVKNISLFLSESLVNSISFSPESISELKKESSEKITLKVKTNLSGELEGNIVASSEELVSTMKLSLLSLGENSSVINSTNLSTKSCIAFAGLVCSKDKKCEGDSTPSLEGDCCLGKCISSSKPSSMGKWIAFILLFLILAALFFFYRKSKKPKPTAESFMKKTEQDFETRMAGQEVKDKLTKS